MKVVFSKEVDYKLLQIHNYIALEQKAPENAEKLIKSIREEIKILENMPRMGRIFTDDLTRFFVIKNHTFVYEIRPEEIFITQVFGAGENWR